MKKKDSGKSTQESFLRTLQTRSFAFTNADKVVYSFSHSTKKYDYMSQDILSLTGYSKEEINTLGIKKIIKEIIVDNLDRQEVIDPTSESEAVEDYFAKYLITTKSGELKWVEDNSFTRIDKQGKRINSIGVLRDVTALHKFINQLHEEKNRLDSILEVAEMIFVVIDENEIIHFINRKGSELLGYKKEEILGKRWREFIPKRFYEDLSKLLTDVFSEEIEPIDKIEIPVIKKNGDEKIIKWHNTVLRDEKGKILFNVSSGLDVTLQKRESLIQKVISQILEASNQEGQLEDFLKFIHNSVKELMTAENFYIALFDKEKNMISFPYFIDKYDKDNPPAPFGKGLTEYVLKTGKSALIDKKTDDELCAKGEIELVGTQSPIWLGIPLKTQTATIGVLVVQDYENPNTYGVREKEILEVISYPISRALERKRVEQEKAELIDELKELNASKDKLFSLISHDLRSPFNSLLGFSEILTTEYDTLTNEEIKEYLNVIFESSKNLYGMTNNLLQYSRFQIGRIEFNPVNLNLKKIIADALKLLKGSIIKKQLNIIQNIEVETEVLADADMLNSIIQNLLSNAIKFTNKGGDIKIYAKMIPFFDRAAEIEVTIEDTGIGISKSGLEKIFASQMYSTPGTEREYGTGLGLLLVKEFVEQNGGRIRINSRLHHGTTFTFNLPVSKK
ncbi:MAG: PAS domain S-box protein [Ignavibacteriales bacterium]|nr:MAG: PAS domain S-box protein [Ignavibacteriales bacterium]